MNKSQIELIEYMQSDRYAKQFNLAFVDIPALCGIVNSGLARVTYQDKQIIKLRLTLSGREYNNPTYYKQNPAAYGLPVDSYQHI